MGSARANPQVNGAYSSQSGGGGGASDQAYQRLHRTTRSDPNYLSPEDATSPPRKFERHAVPSAATAAGVVQGSGANGVLLGLGVGGASFINRRRRERTRERSRGRRKKGVWKKLLWVKQSYPDNYTDEETFLDHLQRNPRLQPYEFWPLMADSTVIVQHLCSVAVFVCCFVGIFQNRVSPVAVVGWGNVATLLGWVLWDRWMAQEDAAAVERDSSAEGGEGDSTASSAHSSTLNVAGARSDHSQVRGLGITMSAPSAELGKPGGSDAMPSTSVPSPVVSGHPTGAARFADYSYYPPYGASASPFSPRNQQRIATAKSAALIYCALLGLSPILKSLTKSTSSDSIWAMSGWLMCINVFFFDYGGAVGSKLPASLSTNAALMASTVLASRLPSTTHVFSLTLFSIEVFGLFPIFRRHLRLHSWRSHLLLTFVLVASAGGGVGIAVSRSGGWKAAVAGVVLGCILTALALGGCIWWLIGLQRYKNEIHGPWDPARPILRRHWD